MKILALRLRNLGPLRDFLELDFADGPLARAGLFAITGDTGAGKTTLLDAITLALFGRTARAHEGEIISHGAAEGMAELEFEVFGGRFRAKWAQQRKKKSAEMDRPVRELAAFDAEKGAWQTMASGTRELDSTRDRRGKIEAELGLNFEQFRRSVMLAQGDFAAFLTADEATRASILERLTDTEIYSELSKKAFEREKWERKRLDEIEAEKRSLAILDEADRTQLLDNQRVRAEKAEALKTAADKLRGNRAWLEQLFSLERRAAELEAQTPFFDQKKAEAEAARARLERHRRAEPFSEKLAQLEFLEAEKTSRTASLAGFEIEKAEAEKAAAEAEKAAAAAQSAFNEAKKQAAEREKIFEKVAVLDSRLEAQAEKAATAAALFQSILDKNEGTKKAIADQKAIADALEKSLFERRKWLAERPNLSLLPAEFSAISLRVEQLGEAISDGKAAAERLAEAEKRLAEATEKWQSAKTNAEKTAAQLLDFQRVRADLLAAEGLEKAENPLAVLNEKIEAAHERLGALQVFESAAREQKRLLEDLAETRENFENAGREADAVQLQLLTFWEQNERLEQDFDEKRRLFERETAFSNFRKSLRSGDPCPLCGSAEHDLAVHAAFLEGDFLEKMSRDFAHVQAAFDGSRAEFLGLEKRLFQLSEIRKNGLELAEKIAEAEAQLWPKVAEKLAVFEGENWARATLEELAEKLVKLPQLIENQQVVRTRLFQFDQKIAAAEREKTGAEAELFRLATERDGAEKDRAERAEKRKDLLNDFSKKAAGLAIDFERFGEPFSHATRAENLGRLEAARVAFERSADDLDELEKKLGEAGRDAAHFESQLAENQRVMSAAEADLTAQKSLFEALKMERTELLGDEKIDAARAFLSEKRESSERLFEQARGFFEGEKIRSATAGERLLNEKTSLEKAEKAASAAASGLEKAVAAAGFLNLEAAKTELLSPEKLAETEQFLAAAADERARFEQSKTEVSAALFEAQKLNFDEKSLDVLAEKLAFSESEISKNAEQIGREKQLLQTDDAGRTKAENLTQLIENQRVVHRRWANLAALIGSADGKKFRVFAQSLTLEKLLGQANRRLSELYGRYEIRRRADGFLDLEIVDHFQAGAARSMATLSGGETFLASLALALGLADLAGSRRAHIQTLFIDEGFGALDENALATALAALENLQSRGTRIGVVSHVKEMKEGIFPQIQVVREGNGASRVRVAAG